MATCLFCTYWDTQMSHDDECLNQRLDNPLHVKLGTKPTELCVGTVVLKRMECDGTGFPNEGYRFAYRLESGETSVAVVTRIEGKRLFADKV